MLFQLLIILNLFVTNPDLETIRDLYSKSVYSEKTTTLVLIDKADGFSEKSMAKAYKAAGLALMAKHKFSPWDKLSYLKKASNLFDEAVKSDINNVEIRFLRLSIEFNTPSFVGMSKNIETDKAMILKTLRPSIQKKKITKWL
jgi:hypothetical protein